MTGLVDRERHFTDLAAKVVGNQAVTDAGFDPATAVWAGHVAAFNAKVDGRLTLHAQVPGLVGESVRVCLYRGGTANGNGRIGHAASSYALRVGDGARQVGRMVESLGADTAGAGALLDDADTEAASALSRPVNGTNVVV